uniref:succinate--CoA ligase (GDP-forming) n=1 Tax=Scleropages formosus TaxID=113540 RepID=A0A8C9SW63_SCLFO
LLKGIYNRRCDSNLRPLSSKAAALSTTLLAASELNCQAEVAICIVTIMALIGLLPRCSICFCSNITLFLPHLHRSLSFSLDAKEIVLKAQILAGGRGKGVFNSGLKGGVHLTKDPAVVGELANKMLGFNLTTKQTPKEGVKVKTVMVAEALDIARETYFAILMDRSCNGPVMVGSPQGGVDIEEVAAKTPELIFKEVIDIFEGVRDEQALRMAVNLGFKGPLERQAADQIKKLYDLFLKVDATQVEVNPLGETPEGRVVCFDAKINFDDNAEFRQKDVFAMEDMTESDPTEMEAAKYDLKYIGLDGNIACFVNGAGLAMATCDIIDLHGGKPANFLDLGGGVKENQVYQAFKLLSADPKVEAILVNIFGGIVNCAIVAKGITKACRELELKVPLVVRLEGGYPGMGHVSVGKHLKEDAGLEVKKQGSRAVLTVKGSKVPLCV